MGNCYPHLSLEERRKIDKWLKAKMPIPENKRLGAVLAHIKEEQGKAAPPPKIKTRERKKRLQKDWTSTTGSALKDGSVLSEAAG